MRNAANIESLIAEAALWLDAFSRSIAVHRETDRTTAILATKASPHEDGTYKLSENEEFHVPAELDIDARQQELNEFVLSLSNRYAIPTRTAFCAEQENIYRYVPAIEMKVGNQGTLATINKESIGLYFTPRPLMPEEQSVKWSKNHGQLSFEHEKGMFEGYIQFFTIRDSKDKLNGQFYAHSTQEFTFHVEPYGDRYVLQGPIDVPRTKLGEGALSRFLEMLENE